MIPAIIPPMSGLPTPAVPDGGFPRGVAGVALVVRLGVDRGVSAPRLLAGTGLDPADLEAPDGEVSAAQELRVVRNLRTTVPELTGTELGLRYHAGTFGALGFALLSSRSVRDAMVLALRFIDLSHAFAIPHGELQGDELRITLATGGLPADLRDFLVERDLVAIHTVLGELTTTPVPVRRVELSRAPGGDSTTLAAALGVRPRLGADGDRLVIAADWLESEPIRANPQSLALSRQLCDEVVSRRRARAGVSRDVRVHVLQRLTDGAPMARVAGDLGWSERTLRRRLAAEGTTYQVLLDEVRAALATELLGSGRLGVEDVALRLGYAEASSLIHAFRRWHGTTPAAFARGDR